MTLYQILNLYIINMVNTSLMAWSLNAEDVNYRELTEFFQKEINIQELLKKREFDKKKYPLNFRI